MRKYIIAGILILKISVLNSGILGTENIPTGIRATAMGEAFTAVADDSTALRWNVAGLALARHSEIAFTYTPALYGSGVYNSYVSLSFPVQKIYGIGIDWQYTGYKEESEFIYDGTPELGYGENFVYAGFARKFLKRLYAGIALKYYGININYDGENWVKGSGIGADAGILYRVTPRITVGLSGKDILPLEVTYKNGGSDTLLNPNITLGLGISPINKLMVALDVNDSVHLGAEYRIKNLLFFRGGVSKGIIYENEDEFTFSGGIGVRYKFAQIDYAYMYNPDLTGTHKFSATFAWGYHAYLVDVITANIKDMFVSLYKSYADKDTVRLVVKNKTKKILNTTVGIYIPDLMSSPTVKKVSLAPGVPTEVKLPILFSQDVMEVKDDIAENAEIVVSYEYDDRKSEDITPVKFVLYNRNAFVWDNLQKIAGFVTPQDENIKTFSRQALQKIHSKKIQDEFISDNFYKALIIFDALGSYGITYITDPNRPFAATKTKDAIDYIQYPAETLAAKSGDCDDCVVLYASCLENVGVPTILMDVPDHIFMMFDAGMTESEAKKKLPENMYIAQAGRVWIPVETTMYKQGFYAAWKEASESLSDWLYKQSQTSKEILRFANIEKAWSKYPSANIPMDSIDIELSGDDIKEYLNKDYISILMNKDAEYSDLAEQYKNNSNDPVINNELGVYFAQQGLYTIAIKYLKKAIKLKKDYASPYNNIGNIYLLTGLYEKAINNFEKSLEIKPDNDAVKLNLKKAKELLSE